MFYNDSIVGNGACVHWPGLDHNPHSKPVNLMLFLAETILLTSEEMKTHIGSFLKETRSSARMFFSESPGISS